MILFIIKMTIDSFATTLLSVFRSVAPLFVSDETA